MFVRGRYRSLTRKPKDTASIVQIGVFGFKFLVKAPFFAVMKTISLIRKLAAPKHQNDSLNFQIKNCDISINEGSKPHSYNLQRMLHVLGLLCSTGMLELRSLGRVMNTCLYLNFRIKQPQTQMFWYPLLKYCLSSKYHKSVEPTYYGARQAAFFKILQRQWALNVKTFRFSRQRKWVASASESTNFEEASILCVDDISVSCDEKGDFPEADLESDEQDHARAALNLINRASPSVSALGDGLWAAVTQNFLTPGIHKNRSPQHSSFEWNRIICDMTECCGISSGGSLFWFCQMGIKIKIGCLVLSTDELSCEACVVSGSTLESLFFRVLYPSSHEAKSNIYVAGH